MTGGRWLRIVAALLMVVVLPTMSGCALARA